MRVCRKIGKFLLDLIEIYAPVVVFSCLFLTFILQIFFRYVLRSPIGWSYEIGLLAFVWTTMLGACYAWRDHEHIVFSLVYDNRTEMGKRVFDILGSLLLLVAMGLVLAPTWKYIMTQRRSSSVLKIHYRVMYFPFFIMIVLSLGHQVYNLCTAVKALVALRANKAARDGKEEGQA